jgi:hypothetical protein
MIFWRPRRESICMGIGVFGYEARPFTYKGKHLVLCVYNESFLLLRIFLVNATGAIQSADLEIRSFNVICARMTSGME